MTIWIFIFCFLISCNSDCNVTKFYEWKQLRYSGSLASDSSFWRYQTQSYFTLRNELAIQLAVADCIEKFSDLYYFKAGRMGPIDIQTVYKQMCSSVCLESDVLHQSAILYTGCSCLELSTQPDSSYYSVEGDFCLENSARLLCDLVGYCGIWDCRLSDFMCPRYEYNKMAIPYKGFGNCVRSSAKKSHGSYALALSLSLFCLLFVLTIS